MTVVTLTHMSDVVKKPARLSRGVGSKPLDRPANPYVALLLTIFYGGASVAAVYLTLAQFHSLIYEFTGVLLVSIFFSNAVAKLLVKTLST